MIGEMRLEISSYGSDWTLQDTCTPKRSSEFISFNYDFKEKKKRVENTKKISALQNSYHLQRERTRSRIWSVCGRRTQERTRWSLQLLLKVLQSFGFKFLLGRWISSQRRVGFRFCIGYGRAFVESAHGFSRRHRRLHLGQLVIISLSLSIIILFAAYCFSFSDKMYWKNEASSLRTSRSSGLFWATCSFYCLLRNWGENWTIYMFSYCIMLNKWEAEHGNFKILSGFLYCLLDQLSYYLNWNLTLQFIFLNLLYSPVTSLAPIESFLSSEYPIVSFKVLKSASEKNKLELDLERGSKEVQSLFSLVNYSSNLYCLVDTKSRVKEKRKKKLR